MFYLSLLHLHLYGFTHVACKLNFIFCLPSFVIYKGGKKFRMIQCAIVLLHPNRFIKYQIYFSKMPPL